MACKTICEKCCNTNPKSDPLHQLYKSPTMRLAECQRCARRAMARVAKLERRQPKFWLGDHVWVAVGNPSEKRCSMCGGYSAEPPTVYSAVPAAVYAVEIRTSGNPPTKDWPFDVWQYGLTGREHDGAGPGKHNDRWREKDVFASKAEAVAECGRLSAIYVSQSIQGRESHLEYKAADERRRFTECVAARIARAAKGRKL